MQSRGHRPHASTFLGRAGGPPLVVAHGPAACGTVQFSVSGKRQAARAADHRLVHPAGPQPRRPELEGPVRRVTRWIAHYAIERLVVPLTLTCRVTERDQTSSLVCRWIAGRMPHPYGQRAEAWDCLARRG